MVSKDRKKREKNKLWCVSNEEKRKRDLHRYYMENKQAELQHKHKRECSQTRCWEKKNTVRVKARLRNDNEYRNINKLRAAMNEKKRRTHPELREQDLAKMSNRMKAKLLDNIQYRQEHTAQTRQYRKSKLQNDKSTRMNTG